MSVLQHDKFFSRALLMLQKLSEEKSVSVVELANEYGVNKRTIYRDINRLHFFPLELRNGFVSVTEGFDINHSKLEEIELLVAELAFNSVNGINPDIDKHIHSIRSKLSHPLFSSPYHIKSDGYEPINMDSELLNKIEDAIQKQSICKIKSGEYSYTVHPYKIVAFDGIWYLFGYDIKDMKVKTYLISKLRDFRATAQSYKESQKDIEKVLENVHTAWFEDGHSFEVKISVKPEVAHYFKLKKHLSSQKIIQERSDGSLIITFSVSSDEDVDNLIKAWLPHIEVLEPIRLKKKIINELKTYLEEICNLSAAI